MPLFEPPVSDGCVMLAPLGVEDAGWIATVRDDPAMRRWMPTQIGTEAEIRPTLPVRPDPTRLRISDAVAGAPLGVITLTVMRDWDTAEVSWWLLPQARGRGAGPSAMRLAARWAFEGLGLERLEMLIQPDNAPSLRAAERCGFVHEGTMREGRRLPSGRGDMRLLSLLPADLEPPVGPLSPRLAAAVRDERRAVLDVVRHASVLLAFHAWPPPRRASGGELLMLHGLGGTWRSFDPVVARLADRFGVVTFDQRGHGRSGKPASGYDFRTLAGDVLAVSRAAGLRRPVLVGHSWGANVALETAVRHPNEFAGIVLIDGGYMTLSLRMSWDHAVAVAAGRSSSAPLARTLWSMRAYHEAAGAVWTPALETSAISGLLIDERGFARPRLSDRNRRRIVRALWQQQTVALMRLLQVPALVLAASTPHPGSEAERVTIEAKREWAGFVRNIGDPVTFRWIRGTHHVAWQRPQAVARQISQFADALTGSV